MFWVFLPWGLVQLYFLQSGIKTSVDSTLYISDAQSILDGGSIDNLWYVGYSIFIATIFYCGGTLQVVVCVQILLSAFSLWLLYLITLKISQRKETAVLISFLTATWPIIHEWNSFIYTESLFTSFSIAFFFLVSKAKRWWHWLIALPVLVMAVLIRPSGVGLLGAGIAFGIYQMNQNTKLPRWQFYLLYLLCISVFLFLLNYMLSNYIDGMINAYASAEIIYPDITFWVSVPPDIWFPEPGAAPLLKLFSFAIHNPLYFAELSLVKGFLFLANVKPYFSMAHNSLIVAFLYPLYAFAIYGFRKIPPGAEKYFIITFFMFQLITVSLTTENWDGRFLVPVLPFIFIYSGIGIINFITRHIESIK